jgi:Na+/melibiose symporter-like transporter
VFLYGLDRWAELSSYRQTRVRDVTPRVVAIATVAVLSVLGTSLLLPGPTRSTWRYLALISSFLGGVPVAMVMEGVRRVVAEEPVHGLKGELVAVLIRLRQLLQRLLAAFGSLVALSTLATGAALALGQSVPAEPGATQLPSQTVLIFGGAGSLLVALFYVPAATALQRRGQTLCDELFPLNDANEASAILSLAEDRHKLEQLLGVDRGVVADLQTGLVILSPLLASAAAAFLSP